jgi:predicted permease
MTLSFLESENECKREESEPPSITAQVVIAMVFKFVVAPCIMFISVWVSGIRGTHLKSMVIQGAIPQATASFVFAQMYDVHPKFSAISLTVGNLLCFPVILSCFFIVESIPYMQEPL